MRSRQRRRRRRGQLHAVGGRSAGDSLQQRGPLAAQEPPKVRDAVHERRQRFEAVLRVSPRPPCQLCVRVDVESLCNVSGFLKGFMPAIAPH